MMKGLQLEIEERTFEPKWNSDARAPLFGADILISILIDP